MKLNPEKCTFRLEGGKFLGFMLTHRGIEANPDKCQAILNMRSPNSVKEVQQLLGRLIALSRFVPRLAKRTRPMVQLLRKGKKFAWDDQCEEIFKQFKEFLTSPVVIQKPRVDHPILVYLAVSKEAVSATVVQETSSVLRQPNPPLGRDPIPDDREGGSHTGPHGKTDAPLLLKSLHNCKNQLPYF